MLILDLKRVGNRMFAFRKKLGMTQAEVAEAAGISDRTYADIERGTVNMRIETFIRICGVLRADPNDILLEDNLDNRSKEETLARLERCSGGEQETALALLRIYMDSIMPI